MQTDISRPQRRRLRRASDDAISCAPMAIGIGVGIVFDNGGAGTTPPTPTDDNVIDRAGNDVRSRAGNLVVARP